MNYLILNSGVSALKYTDRLKALREGRDLTQEKIAKELKVSQITYSQYERGVRGLPTEQLIALCRFYKVSADYILCLPKDLAYPE